MAKEMAMGFTILSLLSAEQASVAPYRAAKPHEMAIKWREVVKGVCHFIRLKTSKFSVITGLNGKMDKIAKTLSQGVFTRASVALSSGEGWASETQVALTPEFTGKQQAEVSQ